MSNSKKEQRSAKETSGDTSFDDLEDAFFATGDADSFWDDPQEEAPSSGSKTDAVDAVPAPDTGDTEEEGEIYNPSELHPEPDELLDEDTEAMAVEATEDPEPPAEIPATQPQEAPAAETERPKRGGLAFLAIDPTAPYRAPETVEASWMEAAASLWREAEHAPDDVKPLLLSEAGRILLARAGQWEEAGQCFEGAVDNGMPIGDIPKGYADVIASQGRFSDLRDLLVARSVQQDGHAAVEALQDAAIVERNHLQDEPAAVALLARALESGDDWFTLRLLREMHYKTQDWKALVDVLDRMATLGSGARSARCKVEEGRIREAELEDLSGAAEAYEAALGFDANFMDAFLALQRVSRTQKDSERLARLYTREANRNSGENAGFWWLRAARVLANSENPDALSAYVAAMDAADKVHLSVHRTAQAWMASTGQFEALSVALQKEAANQTGDAKVATLLYLGLASSQTEEGLDSVATALEEGVADNPSCLALAGRLVACHLQQGKPEKAQAVLGAMVEALSESDVRAAVLFRRGEIAEGAQKDPSAAAKFYMAAHAESAEHPFAGHAAARCLHLTEQFDAAVSVLQGLAESAVDPESVSRLWFQISQIQRYGIGNVDAANTAAQLAFDASSVQPAAIDAWLDSLLRGDDDQQLADGLASASQLLPGPFGKIDCAYRAASLFLNKLNQPAKARALLQRCVEIDPHCGPALALLRAACERANDWAAVYDLRRMEAANASGQDQIWHLMEAAHVTQMSAELDAQTVALEIIAKHKKHPGALAALERSALQGGDAHRLVGVYRRLRSSDEDPGARTAYSVRLADIASTAGDRQLATRSITRVLEASVGPRPYGVMAQLAVDLEAWALAEAALHAHGDDVGLARLLEATSDDQKRISSTWRSIITRDPEHLEAHGGLERALSRMGSREGLADTHASLAEHESDPTISTMHALLAGHLYENEENPTAAARYYGKAFSQSKYRGKAFESLVRIHGEQGAAAEIQDVFSQLGVDDKMSLADALHDGGADEEAGQVYRDAMATLAKTKTTADLPLLVRYEKHLERSEKWPEVFGILGARYEASNSDTEQAFIDAKRRWVLSERMADSNEAWEFYRALHESQPEDRDVLENLARIAGARGERALAIQFLDGLSNIAESADEAARYQRRIAEVHLANEAPSEARSALLRALDHLPEDLEALAELKNITREEEDWQGLVGALSRELEILRGDQRVSVAREIALVWEDKIGDDAVAADGWEKVIELAPNDKGALEHLVSLAERNANWANFIDNGKSLVHFLDGEALAGLLARMGRVALQHLRREEDAIRFLDRASTCDPPSLQAAEDLERIYAARGSWDLVIECTLRRARASEGEAAVGLYLQAARYRNDHLRDRKGAAAAYDEALKIDPQEAEALRFKGHYLFDNNRLQAAVDVFVAIEASEAEIDLDDFDVSMEQALYYFRFGEALRRLEQTENAVTRYEQALELNASHLPTLEAIGPLYVETQQWGQASKAFRQVLQLTGGQGDPSRLARVYACLGTVEQAQGNIAKAAQRFKKALDLQPNDVDALQGYACVLYAQKDWNNLLNAYNNIIYHAKEKRAFIDAYLMKGFVLDVHMALSDKAAQHYEKSLSFDPSHPIALLRLAELALRKDEWDRALSYASRALSVGGDCSDDVRGCLMLTQAVAFLSTGRSEEAQAATESAQTVSKKAKQMLSDQGLEAGIIHEALRSELSQGL